MKRTITMLADRAWLWAQANADTRRATTLTLATVTENLIGLYAPRPSPPRQTTPTGFAAGVSMMTHSSRATGASNSASRSTTAKTSYRSA